MAGNDHSWRCVPANLAGTIPPGSSPHPEGALLPPSPHDHASPEHAPAPTPVALSSVDCQACGACCAYSAEWPRFTLESDAALARIPEKLVAADLSGMRCSGGRCDALIGEIGSATACGIYDVRPDVCRACLPGDPECRLAREKFGMPPFA